MHPVIPISKCNLLSSDEVIASSSCSLSSVTDVLADCRVDSINFLSSIREYVSEFIRDTPGWGCCCVVADVAAADGGGGGGWR